jgi:glycosyl transferase, family 25
VSKSIIFIADYFVEDCFGGAELVDKVIIEGLEKNAYEVTKIKCADLNGEILSKIVNDKPNVLIGNFGQLHPQAMNIFATHCRYSIIEHDHKYLQSRNVAIYKDCLVPPNEIINREFYANAYNVFCQSDSHAKLVSKNLGIKTINLSTSIWSDEDLDIMEKHCSKPKNGKTMVLGSNNPIKNTKVAQSVCEANGIDYDTVGPLPYPELMSKMAEYSEVLFLPTWQESFNRFIVEAKMLGCRVKTNNRNGATSEPWFKDLSGIELINFMRDSKPKFIEALIPTEPENSDKFNNLFDKTYLINLASRKDRLQRAKKRLGDLNITYERFEAIDGKTLDSHPHLKPGEVGCYMSHLNILKDAKQNNYQSILILEDDVVFENNMLEKFYNGYKHIPDDWEIIYLGANHNQPPTRINEYVVECNHAFTTSAMIIRGSALEKLLAESRDMTKQIDVVYADLQATKKLKAYAFHPWLMYQEDGYSDIQGRDMSYTNLMRR